MKYFCNYPSKINGSELTCKKVFICLTIMAGSEALGYNRYLCMHYFLFFVVVKQILDTLQIRYCWKYKSFRLFHNGAFTLWGRIFLIHCLLTTRIHWNTDIYFNTKVDKVSISYNKNKLYPILAQAFYSKHFLITMFK